MNHFKHCAAVLSSLVLLLVATSCENASVNPSDAGESIVVWIGVGGPPSVSSFAVSDSNLFAGSEPGLAWFGSPGTPGGVFRYNGANWTSISNGLTDTWVEALVAAPNGSGGTNLFAGTPSGVFRSTNNGTSWAATSTPSHFIRSLAVSGASLVAGTDGGAFYSTNSGGSWYACLPGPRVNVLTVSPTGAGSTNLLAGTDEGVFLSTNDGWSWTAVNTGLPEDDWVVSLAVSPGGGALNANMFAGTLSHGVFLSTDNGSSWTAVNNGLDLNFITALAISGENIFAGNINGVFLSTNNGSNWIKVNTGLRDTNVRALAISGADLFAGTYGVYRARVPGFMQK